MVEAICFTIESLHCLSFHEILQEILLDLVFKTSYVYVLVEPSCFMSTIACFDLWMSKGVYYIFALVISFLDENLQPKKVTIGLFEAIEITGQTLVTNLKEDQCLCKR
jgi:hypothetical protein